jgi:hypothetical protein
VKLLFDNATEKFDSTIILYDRIPVQSLDTPDLMMKRLQAMYRFVEEVKFNPVKSCLAGAKNCMEGI